MSQHSSNLGLSALQTDYMSQQGLAPCREWGSGGHCNYHSTYIYLPDSSYHHRFGFDVFHLRHSPSDHIRNLVPSYRMYFHRNRLLHIHLHFQGNHNSLRKLYMNHCLCMISLSSSTMVDWRSKYYLGHFRIPNNHLDLHMPPHMYLHLHNSYTREFE